MIERILAFSVRRRWLVLLVTLAAAVFGAWSLTKLPIDAVPDVTNVQVQINAIAPALSPIEIEKQVTFPIETALAGTPGLEFTRSFHATVSPRSRLSLPTGRTSTLRASRWPSALRKQRQLCRRASR